MKYTDSSNLLHILNTSGQIKFTELYKHIKHEVPKPSTLETKDMKILLNLMLVAGVEDELLHLGYWVQEDCGTDHFGSHGAKETPNDHLITE